MPNLSRREFLKVGASTLLGGIAAVAGGYTYATRLEPGWLEITHLELTLPRLPATFDGYRLVQISDIHMDSWMTQSRLANIVNIVNDQNPDSIAITGDFVSVEAESKFDALVSELSRLKPHDISTAVLGNHDHWTNPAVVSEIINQSGIININNAVFTIRRGAAELHLAGVDDFWEKQDRLDLVLQTLPKAGCAILLAHEPDFADLSAPTGRFDLQISGHSHGGQVIFPIMGPIVVPNYARKYPLGLYQVGDMLQYTNRGVGMIPPRVRFNCRPEITVFTFRSPT